MHGALSKVDSSAALKSMMVPEGQQRGEKRGFDQVGFNVVDACNFFLYCFFALVALICFVTPEGIFQMLSNCLCNFLG